MSGAQTAGLIAVWLVIAVVAGVLFARFLATADMPGVPDLEEAPVEAVTHPSDSADSAQLGDLARRIRSLELSRETEHAEVMAAVRKLTNRLNGQRGGRPPAAEEPDEPVELAPGQLDLAQQLTAELTARRSASRPETNGSGRGGAFPPEWFR